MKKIFILIFFAITFHSNAQTTEFDRPAYQPVLLPIHPGSYGNVIINNNPQENTWVDAAKEAEKQRREDAKICITTKKDYYTSFKKYPSKIIDGWHIVSVTNNIDFCEERKVFVKGDKITNYTIYDRYEKKIAFTAPIREGKTLIKFEENNGSISNYYEVYFIDNIIDSTITIPEPLLGNIAFWVNFNPNLSAKNNAVKVYINNQLIGSITDFHKDSEPICGQSGLLYYTQDAGKYPFRAELGNRKWEGFIEIPKRGCATYLIKK